MIPVKKNGVGFVELTYKAILRPKDGYTIHILLRRKESPTWTISMATSNAQTVEQHGKLIPRKYGWHDVTVG